jgi:MFS family permease
MLGVGRLNQIHRHDWPFISAPRIHRELFGAESAIDSGFEVGSLLPSSFYLDLTAGVTSGFKFGHSHSDGARPNVPTHYLRAATYNELPRGGGMQTGLNFLSRTLTDEQFFNWGWRVPFLASATLVLIGLYVRLTITETPIFAEAMKKDDRKAKVPVFVVFRDHPGTLLLGMMISIIAYTLFYMHSVFALSWGTSQLGYTRNDFLVMQLFAILFFAATIPIAGILAERGRRKAMIWMTIGAVVYGVAMPSLFTAGTAGAVTMMCLGFGLTGLVYGPLGTVLSELFPTAVRYTGSSISFNLAGILGASLAPYAATWLAQNYGLQYVGYYISGVALLSLVGLLLTKETKDTDLRH